MIEQYQSVRWMIQKWLVVMMGAPRRDAQTAGVSLGVLITTAEREQDLFLFHKLGSDET